MVPYKLIRAQIPTQLNTMLSTYAQSVQTSTDSIIVDGIARLTERLLIVKAFNNLAFIKPLKTVHDLRNGESKFYGYDHLSMPNPIECMLMDILTCENPAIKQRVNIEQPGVITFERCSRVFIQASIPRPLIEPMHEARDNSTIHNFVTEAVFYELLHRLSIINTATTSFNNRGYTMTTQEFIPASPTETTKLLAEIRELRTRLTRLELDRYHTTQDSELITEVLIDLIRQTAAKQPKG